MELLKEKILKEGTVGESGILKVDSFLNHQLDIQFLNEIGKEFKELFSDKKITKILTIEASGIAIASIAAQYFNVPVVFAKKTESKNLDKETYDSDVYSFTKGKTYKIKVSKKYIQANDKVLILDDFLANGYAALGLINIVEKAGGSVEGVGIVIEKGFQEGGKRLRESGVNLKSLVTIESLENNTIKFK
ncbi:xanthine phosphoribosyltransferase Xpt [Gottschalkia purinilytica]|uniref:Xanthine phosphoribosyltransferase n=1 Tax=Gottschalkia purinilytica TaxID=1503 RepID=A0A0L0WEU8_GOTPU|nr:xanthine phosphoribosyltransferase [Gottschalkia purinilytica]KNF10007.1 xanthine phosphoribosyltransferase Xpt [Gottschalkia purinilytica]